ncbi:kinase-like domain-containing protein [Tanacetum coccineum]
MEASLVPFSTISLLVEFSLAVNHLTGRIPSDIGGTLPNLEWLQLRDNKLTGVLPPSISNCSKLGLLEMASMDAEKLMT